MQGIWSTIVSSILPRDPAEKPLIPLSVNYFPHRKCNYSCEFCFHTTKNLYSLPIEEAKQGLRELADAGMKKLNISGGEPFLMAEYIGEIFRFCKEELKLESCSVVNNGSKVTEKWLDKYGKYLDFMAISCDSFSPEVNAKIGRAESTSSSKQGKHIPQVFQVADWCKARGIGLKINSVITTLNWQEDMNENISALAPDRWKVFQVLLLDGENTGQETNSIRDARHLTITKEQFDAFLDKHSEQECLVPENNEDMKDSYLCIDEEMRFLNCQNNGNVPGRSLLKVGVREALKDAGYDEVAFYRRGGVFEWTKAREDENQALDW